jgi:hypothetical protein
LTKFDNGWKFTVVMARRLQYGDQVKPYEGPTAVEQGVAHKTHIKVEGFGGRVRKKGRQKKKSSK